MWSRKALLAALAGAALAASGCGFKPVHGSGGGDALDGRVAVSTPAGRLGYVMREALERRLGRGGSGADWRLSARIDLAREGLAITEDSSITRYVLRAEAPWVLAGPGGARVTGTARSMSAYSADGSLYASRAAKRDAEARVAEDLGERIAAQLATALAAGKVAAGAGPGSASGGASGGGSEALASQPQ